MATYKVIQDIEAEDKLIGPLTLRQSIFAGIAAIGLYICFVLITKGLSLFLIVFLPPTLFAGFFAFPWGRDQSTEVWALAKIRYFIKSRRRLWDQTGARDLVTVTAPKREVKRQTNGLSATEVQSRLSALANTLDTRGWAVKNVYSIPPLVVQQSTDRLIDFSNMPQQVSSVGITDADDMLDSDNNVSAHRLQEMVTSASASHKQSLLEHMQQGNMPSLPAPTGSTNDYWFTNNPISVPASGAPVATASVATDVPDAVIVDELEKRMHNTGDEHLKTIEPLDSTNPAPSTPPPTIPPVTPATIHLSQRDDLNIATIARIAKGEDNEVVIPLH